MKARHCAALMTTFKTPLLCLLSATNAVFIAISIPLFHRSIADRIRVSALLLPHKSRTVGTRVLARLHFQYSLAYALTRWGLLLVWLANGENRAKASVPTPPHFFLLNRVSVRLKDFA